MYSTPITGRHRFHQWVTLTQKFLISLDELFLELHCISKCFHPIFLLSLSLSLRVRPAWQSDCLPRSFPLSHTGISPSKVLLCLSYCFLVDLDSYTIFIWYHKKFTFIHGRKWNSWSCFSIICTTATCPADSFVCTNGTYSPFSLKNFILKLKRNA